MLESSLRKIDGVPVLTGWASIGNSDGNGIAVVGVGNLDLRSAEAGVSTRVTIAVSV